MLFRSDYSEEIQKSIREKTGKLERTKTHLDKLINSAREFAVISIDDDGTIVSFSEGSKGIFGWKPEEIEGANISRLRTGDDPGSIKRLLKRALKTFSRTSSIDQISETRVRMIRKDGSQFIGDISLSPIIIDSERPGFIVIIHDITIKTEIEKKLAKSRQRYKGFIEALRDSLFTLDRDGNFLWANKYFVELSGYSIDELISDIRPGNIFVLSEDRDKKFQEMSSWATEMKLVHKSGKHIPVSLTMSTIKEEGAEIGMVGVLKDLTKTKENEEHLNNYTHELQKSRSELEKANQKLIAQQEELKTSKTELEKLNKMKNSFIASLSQELKTPLVAGMGYIDLILNGDAGVIDNEIQNYLQISFRNFKKLTIMIDNLLTMSAFSQDDALPSFDVVDLASRLHEWIEEDIHARNATVTVDIPQAASMVYADEYFLSQVFSNLLQYSKEKDERVPYINIDAAPRPNKKVEVSYHDENMDLSEEEAEHIFDSFLESELDPDSSMGISDMGMSIVKSIIELHGGTIEINPSGNTKGTRFVFSLQRHMD